MCGAQLSTMDHLEEPGFWPTQNGTSRDQYTGPETCATCHAAKVASQQLNAMAQNSMHASQSDILRSHPELSVKLGKYLYEIRTSGGKTTYSVTDGAQKLQGEIVWAFGVGRAAQSYLFRMADDPKMYEARVTFFDSTQKLDFTPARALESPRDIAEAMGRPVPSSELERCFACHTTASTVGGQLDERKLSTGIRCEACHGPGAKHAAAAQLAEMSGTPDAARGTIFNPASLQPGDAVDFCGACHSTFWDVRMTGAKGVATAKAQPFRLEESKCWRSGDARLTCFSCHDPHVPLQKDAAAYDHVCLQCHGAAQSTAAHNLKTCKVATSKCTSCHMPKVFVPEMHYSFSDHRIRIAKEGEPYPD